MTYCYIDDDGYEVCNDDAWDSWERWVVLGVVLGGILLLLLGFFLFSCISARRRRKAGIQPYKGTAWTLGITPPGHNPPTYTPNAKDVELGPQAPPAYTPSTSDGSDDQGREVRPGNEQGLPVYPPTAQQPLPREGHEPTQ